MSARSADGQTIVVDTPEEAQALPLAPLLVREPLAVLLDAHGIGEGPIEAQLIGEGHSNVTFIVTRGSRRFVLRRPPRPPYQESAHDVVREVQVLRALAPTAVPVPRVLLSCEDRSILGVPFYLMDELVGDVITDRVPTQLDTPEGRQGVADRMVDALVDLHALDATRPELASIGRPGNYLERQMRRFGTIWDELRTREVPAVDEVTAWLTDNLPTHSDVALVHGDFRPANVMWAPSAPARIIGVLDWEIATIGDPLCDLGWMLSTWPEHGDAHGTLLSEAGAIADGDFPSRAALAARYAERSGRSVDDITWYTAFAFWRAGVGLESFYRRALDGTSTDPFIHALVRGVPELAERALAVVRDA
ncbi:MAG: phosphotransferase family protein [Solirubrobacteraceae bacterium]